MAAKKMAIIGAGISGLSAGCYGQMNGYEATIFESHNLPGGLCTAWHRKGYTFDGCIHWLTDSAPGPNSQLYDVWEELGAVQGREMVNLPVFWRIVDVDGRAFSLYSDPDRLEAHMKDLSPADAEPIEQLCAWVRKFSGFGMPVGKPRELMGKLDTLRFILRMRKYLRDLQVLTDTSMRAFSERFKDPLLASGLTRAISDDAPLLALVSTLEPMSRQAAGYPLGGSLPFARAIEERYILLGGRIRYGARVARILEDDGRAVGIELEDGTRVEADVVISAADMRTTLTSLLDGTRQDETHRVLLEKGKLYPSSVQVSFGVRQIIRELDDCLGEVFALQDPIHLGGVDVEWITVRSYGYDPSLAPEGCSVVTSLLPGDWEFWKQTSGNRPAYAMEKERISDACAEAIDARYPGFKSAIDIIDVATPATFERYTGNWKGTFMTWMIGSDFQKKHGYVQKTVPGLDNLYLASMWTFPPGGLPSAALAGREVIQLICHRDKKRFVALKP